MTKAKTKTAQPQPEVAAAVSQDVAEAAAQETIDNVHPIGKGGKRRSIFDDFETTVSASKADKMRLMGTARQQLAEAADAQSEAGLEGEKALKLASKAAMTLYQGQMAGLLGKDEVSAMLGDVFGFKSKKDGSPSRTPAGPGEAIRKRLVRLDAARSYVDNPEEHDGFFSGVSLDNYEIDGETRPGVASILAQFEQGDLTIWRAYDHFGQAKRDSTSRVATAFNPVTLAKMAAEIAEGGAQAMLNNPSLIPAYKALADALSSAGEMAAELRDAA